MGRYLISPVGYEEGKEDRAYEPTEFRTREQAEEFITNMGSRWILYPSIEIYRRPNILKRFARWLLGRNVNKLDFVVGYDEIGEYKLC